MRDYNNDTYFTIKTDAGRTTILYDDISAVTHRVVSDMDNNDEMFEYDIHMKSGTIFTTRQRFTTTKDTNWEAKWLEMHTLKLFNASQDE